MRSSRVREERGEKGRELLEMGWMSKWGSGGVEDGKNKLGRI